MRPKAIACFLAGLAMLLTANQSVLAGPLRRNVPNLKPKKAAAKNLAWLFAFRLDTRFDDPNFDRNQVPAPDANPLTLVSDSGHVAIAKTEIVQSELALSITPAGGVKGCSVLRSSLRADLDVKGCALLSDQKGYRVLYAGPSEPIENRLIYSVTWASSLPSAIGAMGSGAGRPIDRTWPRLSWANHVRFVDQPSSSVADGASVTAGGLKNSKSVSLDVFFSAAKGFDRCGIGVSSGSDVDDKAACEAASKLKLKYPNPCETCGDWLPIPLKFDTVSGMLRYPSPGTSPRIGVMNDVWAVRERVTPLAFQWRNGPPTRKQLKPFLGPGHVGGDISMNVNFDATGKILGCSPLSTAPDPRQCELLKSYGRVENGFDVFGEPAEGSTTVRIRISKKS